MLLGLLPCWSLLLIAPWQRSEILPAFVSASAEKVAPERSCLPSLCPPRASLFALLGVPQLEGLSLCCWVGGLSQVAQQNGTTGSQLVEVVALQQSLFVHPSASTAGDTDG